MDCSSPGSSVHGILQARILEWVAMPFSRGSSWPRDWTWVSCTAAVFFTIWATREAQSILSYIAFLWGKKKSWTGLDIGKLFFKSWAEKIISFNWKALSILTRSTRLNDPLPVLVTLFLFIQIQSVNQLLDTFYHSNTPFFKNRGTISILILNQLSILNSTTFRLVVSQLKKCK